VLILVDREGMTLTAVAKALGISRQMASRLYATAQPGAPRSDQPRPL
jgi:predicted transcriptional regulator